MTADEQKEAAAAVEVTTVEADIGLVYVTFDRVHERLGCGRSVGDSRAVVGQELDELGAAYDSRPINEVGLVKAALFEARGTDVDITTECGEAVHQILERHEPFLVDVVGITLFGNTNSLGAEEDHGLLLRAQGSVGYYEGHGGLVGVCPWHG